VSAGDINIPSPSGERSCTIALNHAKDSYANGQSVIRLIDTKTGAVTGLATLTTAIPAGIFRWYFCDPAAEKAPLVTSCHLHPNATLCISGLLLLAAIAGVISIVMSVQGLVARRPRKHKVRSSLTILFPHYSDIYDKETDLLLSQLPEGLTLTEVLQEYKHQILEIGVIITYKIKSHRHAVHLYQIEVLILLFAAMLAFAASFIL
jgi:hypothetical protein